MLRTIIKRAFCISNKQPIHIKNKANDHYRALSNSFNATDDQKIKGNYQQNYHDNLYLQKTEIETRILKILYQSQLVERLDKFNFSQDMRKQLNWDSLNITVILTQIQSEFSTVFIDNVFESVRNLQEIVTILTRDPKIF